MSQKPDDFNRRETNDRAIPTGNVAMSDKRCPVDQSESDSESEGDQKRAPRLGLRGGRYRQYSLAQKLAARTIARPSGCWEVQGHALHSGHVQLSVGSVWNPPYVRVRAHVFAWEQATGRTVPPGKVVMHSCDNPRCVNPDHLSIGTQRDNILDSIRKGRYNAFGIQKLDAVKVRAIRALAATGMRHKDIAAQFGVGRTTITGILNGATWSHLDRPFESEAVRAEASLDAQFERVPHVLLPVAGEVR
jgi:hypothetical protein